jgi:hypothetical protein
MPTNSNYDGFFAGIGGIPLFTYGMITVTTIVLAYMTIMEPDELVEEVVDSTVSNSSFMTNLTAPLPEDIPSPVEQIPEEEVVPPEEEVAPPEEPEEKQEEMGEPSLPVETKGGKKRRRTQRRTKKHRT